MILIDNVEGDLDMVNFEDIEMVIVLKDVVLVVIYGVCVVGGVILVIIKCLKGEIFF